MTITIASFDATDTAAIEAAYRVGSAANDADVPGYPPFCRRRFEAIMRHPMPGVRTLSALARADGEAVGYLTLQLPQLDNTENATVELTVDPAYRRHGVGRALHEHCLRLLREQGRKRVIGMAVSALPDGPPRSEAG
ncbi:GNAT family N-acetyltransferase, partial [Micromonospora azadirachtae]